MDEKDHDSGVKVSDKRRFSSDGTARQETEPSSKEIHQHSENCSHAHDHDEQDHSPQDFEINFPTFILSLASSVQISLGLIPHPQTKKAEVNLIAAKQTIDILGMLEEKTKGNLNADEANILKQILFELRMQYVECSKK